MALPDKKASRIKLVTSGDLDEKDRWESHFEWLLKRAEGFQAVFPKYIRESEAQSATHS